MRAILLTFVLGVAACGPSPNYVADMSKLPPVNSTWRTLVSPGSLPVEYWRCLQRSPEPVHEVALAECRSTLAAYVADLVMAEDRKPDLVQDLETAGYDLLLTMPRPSQ